ncbi:hypothetical protein NIASO_09060 [Niabella soli DSM 19437]|uniref:Uncharacterized protein n=1 Tax=Niabella soli DSM 19437 TaxID=929713 RepID=W0F3A4_9BACT|nr:hypothetical protein NIASO_09060 [Niabella soli DSM 19437]
MLLSGPASIDEPAHQRFKTITVMGLDNRYRRFHPRIDILWVKRC